MTGNVMRRAAREGGFALIFVMLTLLVIELIGVEALSVATSNLHGAVASRLAVEATNAAEAGMNHAVAQLVVRASMAVPTDETYAGDPSAIVVPGPDPEGTIGYFWATVECIYPLAATPPDCRDDAGTPGINTRDFRHIISVGVPGPSRRARRQIEATVRRYTTRGADTPAYGICGRDGVVLDHGTTVTSDVGSNGDVRVEESSTIRQWDPIPPVSPATAINVPAPASTGGLNGTFSWRVTVVDAAGRESGGSPPTPPLALAGEYGGLTEIPLGDTSITTRRIYRTRANAAVTGPWYLVTELPDDTTRAYTDPQADSALGFRMPGTIAGNVVAGGSVECSGDCGTYVDGKVRSHAREVVCPAFLPPPCRPGIERVPSVIVQHAFEEHVHWGPLHMAKGDILSILTLSDPHAGLHIHVSDIDLGRDALVVVSGRGTVYFHVSGTVHLADGAAVGVADQETNGRLITPSDRIQILSCAHDPAYDPKRPETASVRWDQTNRVSAFMFAPEANIVINRAVAFRGGAFAKFVHIGGSTGTVLDPTEGVGSEHVGIRPSPFQYMVRWYDNPSPHR
jgi:hypothetical protein